MAKRGLFAIGGPVWKARFYARRRLMALWWAWTRRYRTLVWRLRGRPVLEVGSIVQWGLDSFGTSRQTWRVQSWLKQDAKGRLMCCAPDEATHVSIYSICVAIVPVGECGYLRMVEWKQEWIDNERARAIRLIGKRVW